MAANFVSPISPSLPLRDHSGTLAQASECPPGSFRPVTSRRRRRITGSVLRALVFASLLICAGIAAGCGGSSLQAKARKVVGDPHATVVSTEKVRALNGQPVTVVVLKPSGSIGLGCGYAGVGGGPTVTSPLVPGCPRSQDAYVELWGSKLAEYGDIGISRFQVAAIAKARSLTLRFQIFPSVNQLTVRCGIGIPHLSPSGGGGPLPGMCATIALPFGKPVRCVAFSEAWRPNAASKLRTHGWVVTFSRDGHVESTQAIAHPPQPWSGHQPQTCSEII